MRALPHAPGSSTGQPGSLQTPTVVLTHPPNPGICPKAVLRICDLHHPLSLIPEQVRKARGLVRTDTLLYTMWGAERKEGLRG